MAKDKLIANRRLRYGRQIVEKDGPFEAGRMESQLLRTLGHARMAPAEVPVVVAVPAVEVKAEPPAPSIPKREPEEEPMPEAPKAKKSQPKTTTRFYQRRDLEAED